MLAYAVILSTAFGGELIQTRFHVADHFGLTFYKYSTEIQLLSDQMT